VTRNVLGYISGDFFTNSSGHPGPRRKWFLWTAAINRHLKSYSRTYAEKKKLALNENIYHTLPAHFSRTLLMS
jgi:hypothetical protein